MDIDEQRNQRDPPIRKLLLFETNVKEVGSRWLVGKCVVAWCKCASETSPQDRRARKYVIEGER